jgi:hypothetical protein
MNIPFRVCSLDTETFPFGPGRVAPPIICMQWKWVDEEEAFGLGNGEKPLMEAQLEALLQLGHLLVGVNIGYDLRVICNDFPELEPLVWAKLEAGEVIDLSLREKLLNLSTTGKLSFAELPDGNTLRIGYSMADLALNHLGIDISSDKDDPASPRHSFPMFDGQPFSAYSARHKQYALDDVRIGCRIYLAQESACRARGGRFVTQEFNTAAAFALFCMTERGAETDPEQFEKMVAMVDAALDPAKMRNLIEAGILREPVAPKPKKDGTFTKGKAASINKEALAANVERACRLARIPVKRTPTGAVCCDAEVIEAVADYDEALQEYQDRQAVGQIKKTEIPRMKWDFEDGRGERLAPVVHFPYNALVETTRTSSMASEHYPSSNGQNVDPRAKPVYKAREGWVFCGADFSTLELVTLGQTCYRLFGKSTHREVILAGRDNHTYLAAPLAYRLDPNLKTALHGLSNDARHDLLAPLKKSKNEDDKKLFKLWRGLAKPVGLGNPGGLGPVKFLSLAKKKPYWVDVKAMAMELPAEFFDEIMDGELAGSVLYHHKKLTGKEDDEFAWSPMLKGIALALELRRVWFSIYPEMKTYFDYVKECLKDELNVATDDEGKPIQLYAYETPLGALRRGCTFTSVANGLGLQSPGAEGAKAAVFLINRECRDKTRNSILFGCRPILFVHDEIICEIPDDNLMHERAARIAALMVEAMGLVCPDVPIKAEPVLMRSWNKDAEPRFDAQGRLTIWTPPPPKIQIATA